ncbi:MAG: alpha/beta fold hydrolase [Pseudomonadota bacterium]
MPAAREDKRPVEGSDIPVVMLHGLGRTSASMKPLAMRLRRHGFDASTLDYPSTRYDLAGSLDLVRSDLIARLGQTEIALVGHSMGGIIARSLCVEDHGLNIRRVIQIGAPNLGSPLADRLGSLWPVRRACGPAVADIRPRAGPIQVDDRIAAIAGVGGFGEYGGLAGPHDGAVSARSAWAGAARRAHVAQIHTLLPLSLGVAHHTAHFLRPPDPATAADR